MPCAAKSLPRVGGTSRATSAIMKLSRCLFLLVSACGPPTSPAPDAHGCGTYNLGPPAPGRSGIVVTASDAGQTDRCTDLCSERACYGFCNLEVDTAGDQILTCTQDHTGRRPAGLVGRRATGGCVTGRYFASAAYLEAASVPAFRQLATELAVFGAPEQLRLAAERAMRDEIRHARVMTKLARQHGAHVPVVRIRRVGARSLEAFARENAIEGCVKETYGAAIALHQADHANDLVLRTTMRAIARDELRHAELAWQVDRWARMQLAPRASARICSTRLRAADRLIAREQESRDSMLSHTIGVPERTRRIAFATAIRAAEWA